MRKADIKVGSYYRAMVSGKMTTVRVEAVRGDKDSNTVTRWEVINMTTGRKTVFGSAAKFRGPATNPGDEQRSDPTTNSSNSTPTMSKKEISVSSAKPLTGNSTLNTTPSPSASGLAAKLADAHKPYTPSVDGKVAGYTPTAEQAAILEAARQPGLKVLVVGAGAGTGKTSTLKMLEEVLAGKIQYTAFNASLVEESKTKFKKAACNTGHSIAFKSVGRLYAHRLGGARVRGSEVASRLGIVDMTVTLPPDLAISDRPRMKVLTAGFLASMVTGALKRFSQSADDEIQLNHFRRPPGIDYPDDDGEMNHANSDKVREYLLPFARKAWDDIKDVNGTLPFTHDYYVKIWQLGRGQDTPIIYADNVLLDEAQDTAPVMLDVLQRQDSLVILVGDDNQQIYEWRGAVNAMAAFPGAPRLLLSQSFRFGQSVADVANSILAGLEEKTDLVMKGLTSIPSRVIMPGEGPAPTPNCILTRTNAMAVGTVLTAVRDGKRPHLIGGGSEVVKFVKAAQDLQNGRSTSHPELCCFENWKEVQEYAKGEDGEDLKTMVKLIDEFGVKPIISALENMPHEANADLVVCTAHKSKGREWKVVQLASDFPPANRMMDSDRRLLYVATTRAQHVLDLTLCTPFIAGRDKVTGDEVRPIYVRWTTPRPTQEQFNEFVVGNSVEVKADTPASGSTPTDSPTPSGGRSEVQTFSWAKHGDEWCVKGPKGATGRVKVIKKSGASTMENLGPVVRSFPEADVYRVSK